MWVGPVWLYSIPLSFLTKGPFRPSLSSYDKITLSHLRRGRTGEKRAKERKGGWGCPLFFCIHDLSPLSLYTVIWLQWKYLFLARSSVLHASVASRRGGARLRSADRASQHHQRAFMQRAQYQRGEHSIRGESTQKGSCPVTWTVQTGGWGNMGES